MYQGIFSLLNLCLWIHVSRYQVQAQCDTASGWAEYNSKCYYISRGQEGRSLTWDAARDFCHQNGGDLASVLSDGERDFITQFAGSQNYTGALWIGYSRRHEADFVWVDGSPNGYEDWGPDQPVTGSDWNGQKHCAYTEIPISKTKSVKTADDFSRLEEVDLVKHLLGQPQDADGTDTFYFGYIPNDNIQECENRCAAEPRCHGFTYILIAQGDPVWYGECMGRSNVYSSTVYDPYAVSGFRLLGELGIWYNDNCGVKKGFVCKKDPGSDLPLTPTPTVPVEGYCPWPWFSVRNRCFLMIHKEDGDDGLSWDDALQACRSMYNIYNVSEGEPMPDLASFHNQEDMAAITSRIQDPVFDFWIGLRKTTSQDWAWVDNTQTDYANWKPEYPSTTPQDDCGATGYFPYPIGGWQNHNCDDKLGYICYYTKDPDVMEPTRPSTSPNACPLGYWPHRNACYRTYEANVTFSEARDICKYDYADLASIQDSSDNAMVFTTVQDDSVWIGLTRRPEFGGSWTWTNGWPPKYFNWADDLVNDTECAVMNLESTWDDVQCDERHSFVCRWTNELPPVTPENTPGICPDSGSWAEFGNYCYKRTESCRWWQSCEDWCATEAGVNFKGHLASVHSDAEHEFQYSLVKEGTFGVYWIGLWKNGSGEPHQWTDGTPYDYQAWAPGEPNDNEGNEHCVEMYGTYWPGLWNDRECSNHNGALCKAEKGPLPTTPPTPTPGEGTCPENWSGWGDMCYWVPHGWLVNWTRAMEECRTVGGPDSTLAIIRDSGINWQVNQLCTASENPEVSCWVGLYKDPVPNQQDFRWVDGSNLTYTNWAPGEPNNWDGTENCGEIYKDNGDWNDHLCGLLREFVCERPKDTGIKNVKVKRKPKLHSKNHGKHIRKP